MIQNITGEVTAEMAAEFEAMRDGLRAQLQAIQDDLGASRAEFLQRMDQLLADDGEHTGIVEERERAMQDQNDAFTANIRAQEDLLKRQIKTTLETAKKENDYREVVNYTTNQDRRILQLEKERNHAKAELATMNNQLHDYYDDDHPILQDLTIKQALIKAVIEQFETNIAYASIETLQNWIDTVNKKYPKVKPPQPLQRRTFRLGPDEILDARKSQLGRWYIAHLTKVLPTLSTGGLRELSQRFNEPLHKVPRRRFRYPITKIFIDDLDFIGILALLLAFRACDD